MLSGNVSSFQKVSYVDKYFFPLLLSRSAHQTPNFTNPEIQFPQFEVLQNVFFFLFNMNSYTYWQILAFLGVFCY